MTGGAITSTTIFGSAGLFALITALWDQIKLYWSKIWGLAFVKMYLPGNAEVIQRLLVNEFKKSPFDEKWFFVRSEYVRPRQKNELVGFESPSKLPTIWWRNRRPLIVSEEGRNLTFLRGTYDAHELLVEALDKYNNERSNKHYKECDRFFIRRMYGTLGSKSSDGNSRQPKGDSVAESKLEVAETSNGIDKYNSFPLKWTRDQLGQPKKDSAINDMSLTPDILETVQEAVRWRESEDWFKDRGIPWKKGFLLYGTPGTGKTAFVRALGQELNMPIISFDLTTMSNSDFNNAWNSAKSWCPCIVLLEDIDGVFEGRKNVVCGGLEKGLSFDCLLNLIDGVENSDGIFTIITTNDLTKIDPAIGGVVNGNGMSTRPGRIDKAIEFKPLDDHGREKMAKRILRNFDISKWGHLLKEKHDDTGAQFQERCCKLALKLFWETKETKEK